MGRVSAVSGRQIVGSRGNPRVEADLWLDHARSDAGLCRQPGHKLWLSSFATAAKPMAARVSSARVCPFNEEVSPLPLWEHLRLGPVDPSLPMPNLSDDGVHAEKGSIFRSA